MHPTKGHRLQGLCWVNLSGASQTRPIWHSQQNQPVEEHPRNAAMLAGTERRLRTGEVLAALTHLL